MRIGVNCFLLQAHMGGLKQYFITLFEHLLEHDRDNEYVFFHFAQNAAELASIRSDRWKSSAILLKDQAEARQHRAAMDLYFCPFGGLWPRPFPLPSVVTLVDIQEVFYPEFFSPADLYSRAYHYVGSTRMADQVLTISEFSKKTIVHHHRVPADKVTVCHLCADERYYRAREVERRPEMPMPAGDFLIYPANRWKHKNHDVLLRALRELRDRGIQLHAVFTGYDQAGGYPLMEKAAEYGLSRQVHSAGYVTVEEMAYLYRRASMLAFPSLFEGFGIPLVEAMAAGCPIATSDAASLPEIGLEAASYFNPRSAAGAADALERILRDRQHREDLIRKGLRRAADFSASRMAERHREAFHQAARRFSSLRFAYRWAVERPVHFLSTRVRHRNLLATAATFDAGGCRLKFIDGWHEMEKTGSDWLRWSTGRARITIDAKAPSYIRIAGEMASITLPNTVEVLANGSAAGRIHLNRSEFGFEPFEISGVRLRAGRNRIELRSSRPAVTMASDPRRLAVAVKNLRCLADETPAS